MITAKEASEIYNTPPPNEKDILDDLGKRIIAAAKRGERKIRWEGPLRSLPIVQSLSNLGYDMHCDDINLDWAYANITW